MKTLLSGMSDANIRFSDLCGLVERLGFKMRINGDHHVFTKPDVVEILNLQPRNGKAKPYQAKQIRGIIHKYRLRLLRRDSDA